MKPVKFGNGPVEMAAIASVSARWASAPSAPPTTVSGKPGLVGEAMSKLGPFFKTPL
ncbi:MAG: hypothetical protein QM599_04630 [Pseudoxanthomonas sp.]